MRSDVSITCLIKVKIKIPIKHLGSVDQDVRRSTKLAAHTHSHSLWS